MALTRDVLRKPSSLESSATPRSPRRSWMRRQLCSEWPSRDCASHSSRSLSNATLGSEQLAKLTDTPARAFIECLSPRGQSAWITCRNLRALRKRLKVGIKAQRVDLRKVALARPWRSRSLSWREYTGPWMP